MVTEGTILDLELADFSCKEPENEGFHLCVPYSWNNYSTLPSQHRNITGNTSVSVGGCVLVKAYGNWWWAGFGHLSVVCRSLYSL